MDVGTPWGKRGAEESICAESSFSTTAARDLQRALPPIAADVDMEDAAAATDADAAERVFFSLRFLLLLP